jgi:uncharacterized membrane protein
MQTSADSPLNATTAIVAKPIVIQSFKNIFFKLGDELSWRVTFPNKNLLAGEDIEIKLEISNQTRIPVNHIKMKLIKVNAGNRTTCHQTMLCDGVPPRSIMERKVRYSVPELALSGKYLLAVSCVMYGHRNMKSRCYVDIKSRCP